MASFFSFSRFKRASSLLKSKASSINSPIEIGIHPTSSSSSPKTLTSMRNPNYDDLNAINTENDDTTRDDVAILPDAESIDQNSTSKFMRCLLYMNHRINQCLDSNQIKIFMVVILFTLNLINYMDRFTVAGKYILFSFNIFDYINETRY